MQQVLLKLFMLMAIILPQVSESILGPSLFSIASDLHISIESAEHAYSFYLFGYAIGMLIWGAVLDRLGSKVSVRYGLGCYLLGCVFCLMTLNASVFMFGRILQGFGGSVCTICAYVMCRLFFEGEKRTQMQANLSIALAAGPSLGPILGQWVAATTWQYIYLPLLIHVILLTVLQFMLQLDTPIVKNSLSIRYYLQDKELWLYAVIVGCACGIGFTFFAEGPYLMIEGLNMSDQAYARYFIWIGISWYLGGLYARYLSTRKPVVSIVSKGIVGCLSIVLILSYVLNFYAASTYIVQITWALIVLIMIFNSLIIGNTIGLALSKYDQNIGTVTSVLGFLYYLVMSISTALMAYTHDGSLIAMPSLWWKMFLMIGLIHYRLHISDQRG
jgi:MFS family permease